MSYAQLLDSQRFVQICYILYTFYNKLLLSICYILVYKKLRNETFPHTKSTTTRRKPPKITRFRRVSIFRSYTHKSALLIAFAYFGLFCLINIFHLLCSCSSTFPPLPLLPSLPRFRRSGGTSPLVRYLPTFKSSTR